LRPDRYDKLHFFGHWDVSNPNSFTFTSPYPAFNDVPGSRACCRRTTNGAGEDYEISSNTHLMMRGNGFTRQLAGRVGDWRRQFASFPIDVLDAKSTGPATVTHVPGSRAFNEVRAGYTTNIRRFHDRRSVAPGRHHRWVYDRQHELSAVT
jgi:hypothetical protein